VRQVGEVVVVASHAGPPLPSGRLAAVMFPAATGGATRLAARQPPDHGIAAPAVGQRDNADGV